MIWIYFHIYSRSVVWNINTIYYLNARKIIFINLLRLINIDLFSLLKSSANLNIFGRVK